MGCEIATLQHLIIMFTDTHCHLDFDEFSKKLPELTEECVRKGIKRIIIPAISPKNWDNVLQLSSSTFKTPCKIFSCLGIHPWFLNDLTNADLIALTDKIEINIKSIIAIGETGIDGTIARDFNNLDKQITFFDHQLILAKKHKLPVIVHHRRSHEHIVPRLKQYKLEHGGIIHAFSGSYQQAKTYVDLGFKLGIGGTITYKRAKKTINALKRLPLDALVLETDAPSMPLSGFQGEANSPLKLVNVFDCLCEIRKEDPETLSNAIEQNVQQLFFNR